MAVVIASALDKDVAGTPLFRGVSFKLERGDRMTLAGPNGAGKTTPLRGGAGGAGGRGGGGGRTTGGRCGEPGRPSPASSTPAAGTGAHGPSPHSTASASRTTSSTVRSAASPAASSPAPRSPARSPGIPTSYSSTSRQTIWTSHRSSGSRA